MRLVVEVVLEDALDTISVASLCVQGRARVVRNHAVTAAERVLHRTPDVVFGCGLDVPDVTSVACTKLSVRVPRQMQWLGTRKVSALEGLCDGIFVTDGTSSSVNEPGSLLEMREEFFVDEALRSLVQGAVDGDDVTLMSDTLL